MEFNEKNKVGRPCKYSTREEALEKQKQQMKIHYRKTHPNARDGIRGRPRKYSTDEESREMRNKNSLRRYYELKNGNMLIPKSYTLCGACENYFKDIKQHLEESGHDLL